MSAITFLDLSALGIRGCCCSFFSCFCFCFYFYFCSSLCFTVASALVLALALAYPASVRPPSAAVGLSASGPQVSLDLDLPRLWGRLTA